MQQRWSLSSVVAIVGIVALAGCSGGDDPGAGGGTSTDPKSATAAATPTSTAAPESAEPEVSPEGTATASVPDNATPATAYPVVEVPEVGVPGLDADDPFCAAWSRFAGSFQVVSVASNFLVDDPAAAFRVEVVAAPTVATAYTAMFAGWPTELESERDAATTVFGPFAARAADAVADLDAAGAPVAAHAEISAAWVTALETRDPSAPELIVAEPAAMTAAIDAAASTFAADHVPVYADPALVNDVATPLTDAFLATACPDQGALAGGEVG